MKLRKHIKPRRTCDALSVLSVAVVIPAYAIYEALFILPAFHEPGGFWHSFAIFLRLIFLFNVEANLLLGMMIDNSVDFTELVPPLYALAHGWHHCYLCDKLAPPRSWHCELCGTCILKRDHHCVFLGNCVGLRNRRHYMLFVFHLLILSTYAIVYSCIYIWVLRANTYRNWWTPLKLLFPPLMLVDGNIWMNFMLFCYYLHLYAVAISWSLFVYHFPLVMRGNVAHERNKGNIYDMGWRRNLREVFGERMFLAVLSPFITSKLPNQEGIEWPTNKKQMTV